MKHEPTKPSDEEMAQRVRDAIRRAEAATEQFGDIRERLDRLEAQQTLANAPRGTAH